MPGRDGTGPLGQGPLTGRGMGFCRRRFGYPRFFRQRIRGRRLDFDEAVLSREQERKMLEEEKKEIEERLKELEE